MSSLPPPPNPLELDELELLTAASIAPLMPEAEGPWLLLWVCVIISPIGDYVGSRSRFFGSCPFLSSSSEPHFAKESCNGKRGQASIGGCVSLH